MTGYIIAAIAVALLFWGVMTFNGLVRLRNMVAEGWSGIEAQLKRRADLIPNLVETVKGYAAHERGTLDELTKLRSSAQQAPSGDVQARAETERQITAMIGRVMAVAEAYPDLKASANFQSLQQDLSEIEDQIQLARRYYNGTVRNFNVMIEQVPSNIIAGWFAFKQAAFFEIEECRRTQRAQGFILLIGRLRIALLAMLFVLIALPHAAAQERITNFVSDIAIAPDGTITVREAISVNAENDRIQRGIFRDIPTVYTDRLGNRVRVGFNVQEVQRDGRPEPYVVETISNGRRVRIGSADVIIDRGPHTFLIVYRTNRQIGFFPTYDELYWNVTGNAWEFGIDRAEAVVRLPPGAAPLQYDFYTGPPGAQGKNGRSSLDGDRVRFVTNTWMAPGEGLTVAVGFSKGAITPPTAAENVGDFLSANGSAIAGLAGLAGIGIYYFAAWLNFGRDPARGVIIPLFAPPKDFSAASVRFVDRMGYDRKTFAAALVAMAVKGYLKIRRRRRRLHTRPHGKERGRSRPCGHRDCPRARPVFLRRQQHRAEEQEPRHGVARNQCAAFHAETH